MGCDMVVALGRATLDGGTLFGHNSARPARERQSLVRTPGRQFSSGERVRAQLVELPQAGRTCTVLASRPAGRWGYQHGVNERGVAVGCAAVATRLSGDRPGLLGTDLVRLALERAAGARQAADLVGDLIGRHGQGGPGHDDCALLIADAGEAFAVEAAGRHWVHQEIREVRAVSDVCTVRQDWDRISPGLAGQAIARGWWPDDGSKLDFAGTAGGDLAGRDSALRRWGRATLLLQEQNGRLDVPFVRRILADHYEGCDDEADVAPGRSGPVPLCRHGPGPADCRTAASLVVELGAAFARLPLAWCAFGPPCVAVYLPVCLAADLPPALAEDGPAAEEFWRPWLRLLDALGRSREAWDLAREGFARLQARIDCETEEFVAEATGGPEPFPVGRQAEMYLQHQVEAFEQAVAAMLSDLSRPRPVSAGAGGQALPAGS